MPTVPVELIDPNGDNNGEYIVTIPDGLFHVVRLARLQYATRLSNVGADGAADHATGNGHDEEVTDDVDSGELELWSRLGGEIVRCVGVEAGRELARMFEYQIGLLAEDTAVRMLADHAVECAVAYIERQSTGASSSSQQQSMTSSSVAAPTRSHRQQKNASSGRRGGVWERNSIVRGAVFGAVFGHTEMSVAVEGNHPAARDGGVNGRNGFRCQRPMGRQVSVVVGQRELKWDVGDILKRPGLRCDRLLHAADLSVVADAPPSPPAPFTGPNRRCQHQQPHHSSTSGIDVRLSSSDRRHDAETANVGGGSLCQLPSVASSVVRPSVTDSAGLRRTGSDRRTTAASAALTRSPWTFHVSAACDARLYGYRGQLLDWDYFAHVYAPVPDDEGWFDQPAPPAATSSQSADDDFHRLYRPRRCLIGTELMQSYCSGTSSTESHPSRNQTRPPRLVVRTLSDKSAALTDFVAARIGESVAAVDGSTVQTVPRVVPVYRPLKAMSLGTASRLRRADFSASDLTRVRLVGADMRRTGLRSCLLSFARMTGVRLGSMNGATVAGSDLSYAVLDDVELPAELRLTGEDIPPFQIASTTAATVKALYAVIEATVDINSPDGASDDIDLFMQSGMKQLSICAPNAGVSSADDCEYNDQQKAFLIFTASTIANTVDY